MQATYVRYILRTKPDTDNKYSCMVFPKGVRESEEKMTQKFDGLGQIRQDFGASVQTRERGSEPEAAAPIRQY